MGSTRQRAAGWDVTGQERDRYEKHGHGGEGDRGRWRLRRKAGPRARRASAAAATRPNATPKNAMRRALAEDQAQDVLTLRAQRHANADFLRAQSDAVGHDAVNSDGREDQREGAEDAEKHQSEAARRDGIVHALLHGVDGEDGLVFINRGDGGANRGGEARGIEGGADDEVHVVSRLLAVRIINFQARGIVQAVEFGVSQRRLRW